MKLQLAKGTTSQRVGIFVQDSSSIVGAGLTGLVFNSSGLTWHYWREDEGNAGATSVTLATATRGTFTSGGFVEKDSTNMPGMYEIGIPDAALASGADWVVMMLKGATDMAPVVLEIQLTDVDMNDGVRGGMTALPNAAADAAGGLPISDGGGLDMDGRLDAAVSSRLAAASAPSNWSSLDIDVNGRVHVIKWAGATVSTGPGNSYPRVDVAAVVDDTQSAADLKDFADEGYDPSTNKVQGVVLVDTTTTNTDMLTAAAVNAEVVDALRTDTVSELGSVPAASPDLHSMVQLIYMAVRNKHTSTATASTINNDAGTAIGTSTDSDDGTTFTRGKHS